MDLPRSFQGVPALSPDTVPAAVRAVVARLDRPVAAYLYDLAAVRTRAVSLRSALPDWAEIFYAVKANGFPPVVAALSDVVDGFEIASAHEATLVADHARRVLVSGPAKNPVLLKAVVATVGKSVTVNVESVLELHRLSHAATEAGLTIPVALRVNPDLAPLASPDAVGLTMGGVASPFGIPEDMVPDAIELATTLPGLDLVGFHVHAMSGNLDADAHASYVDWFLRWSVSQGVDLRSVDVGGGLGYPFEGVAEFDLDRFGALLSELDPPDGVTVMLEPGRWLAAPIGWYAVEVVDLKSSHGVTYAVVRGGINHFQLPTSWDIRHNFAVVPLDDWPSAMPRPGVRNCMITVSGELCTPEDVLARDVLVAEIRAGDVLVFPNAGAYGYEFAMHEFLGHPPAQRVGLP